MENKGLWDEGKERETRTQLRKEVLVAFAAAEAEKKAPLRAMFEDVYEEMSEDCERDRRELKRILETYPDEYNVEEFEGGRDGL